MEPGAVFEKGRLHFAVLVAALLALRSELADLPDLSLPENPRGLQKLKTIPNNALKAASVCRILAYWSYYPQSKHHHYTLRCQE